MYDQWTLTTQYFEIRNITGPYFMKYAPQSRLYWAGRTQHQLISNINSCLTSPNTLKDLFFPPRYPDIERLADIFEVITVNLTRMFVQWFWYRMETQGSNNLGENPFLSQGITSIGENTSTRRSDGDGVWRWKILLLGIINMKNISHSYKCFLLQAIASAAWGFVQASRETDEEQERAWCQVNLNQLFLQF